MESEKGAMVIMTDSIGIIDGINIVSIRTRKSQFDQDCVVVTDDKGNDYLLHVTEIMKMTNEFNFTTEKKIKHTYLRVKGKFMNGDGENNWQCMDK